MLIFKYSLLITFLFFAFSAKSKHTNNLTNILTWEEINLISPKGKKELAKYFMVRSCIATKNSKMNLKENGIKYFTFNDFLKRAALLNLGR